jgi:hypothetical protein
VIAAKECSARSKTHVATPDWRYGTTTIGGGA